MNAPNGDPFGAFETVKKVVIPSQCAHSSALRAGFRRLRYAHACERSGLGDLPDDRNIFDSENIGFPKIWGDRHTSLRAGSR